jgi:hypothetical protein
MMDWTQILITAIGALTAAGGVGGLFQIKEARRAKRIENDRSAADEWKELYERSEAKAERLGEKLGRVYSELRKEQEGKNETKVELERAKFMLCRKTPCVERDPPLGRGESTSADKIH